MPEARPAAGTATGATAPQQVLLLALWSAPGQAWRARLLGADSSLHDFSSPFELARFLAQPAPLPVDVSKRTLK